MPCSTSPSSPCPHLSPILAQIRRSRLSRPKPSSFVEPTPLSSSTRGEPLPSTLHPPPLPWSHTPGRPLPMTMAWPSRHSLSLPLTPRARLTWHWWPSCPSSLVAEPPVVPSGQAVSLMCPPQPPMRAPVAAGAHNFPHAQPFPVQFQLLPISISLRKKNGNFSACG
jgi:hypothetical protein